MRQVSSTKPETAHEADDLRVPDRQQARQYEQEGDNKNAIAVYEQLIKKHPLEALLFDRLMILYRKEKQFKKELALLEKAINSFTELLLPSDARANKKVANLSKSISQSVGLADKKGAALYYPQPIAKWQKRKIFLKKKIAAQVKGKG